MNKNQQTKIPENKLFKQCSIKFSQDGDVSPEDDLQEMPGLAQSEFSIPGGKESQTQILDFDMNEDQAENAKKTRKNNKKLLISFLILGLLLGVSIGVRFWLQRSRTLTLGRSNKFIKIAKKDKKPRNIIFDMEQFQQFQFSTPVEELKQRVREIDIVGHRGGYEPSNTLKAFQKAVDFGLKTLEIDVELSKDLIPMVIHTGPHSSMDPFLSKKGTFIYEYTAEELRGFNLTKKGDKIPFLNETLQFCKDNNLNVIFDIKGENNLVVGKTLDMIQKYQMEKKSEIFSYRSGQLLLAQEIKEEKAISGIPLTRLIEFRELSLDFAQKLNQINVNSVGIVCSEYDREFLYQIKEEFPQMKISCWYYRYDIKKYKIKQESFLSYMESLDRPVDRVIVDFPPTMKQVMDSIINEEN